jgi:hypothetical protein
MNTSRTVSLVLAIAVSILALPVSADRGGDSRFHHDRRWRGDIHVFHVHDHAYWRSGRWVHTHRDGRLGWWWVVGGLWYFYPRAVYPYPDPYVPPTVIVQAPPSAPAAGPAPAQNWYYCTSSKNYYPYVATCAEGWKTVPATPVDVAPNANPETQP